MKNSHGWLLPALGAHLRGVQQGLDLTVAQPVAVVVHTGAPPRAHRLGEALGGGSRRLLVLGIGHPASMGLRAKGGTPPAARPVLHWAGVRGYGTRTAVRTGADGGRAGRGGTARQDQTAREIPGATLSPVTDSKDASAEVVPLRPDDAGEPTFGEVRPATRTTSRRSGSGSQTSTRCPTGSRCRCSASTSPALPTTCGCASARPGPAASKGTSIPPPPCGHLLQGFATCPADEGSCVEVGEDRPEYGGPHLFGNRADTMLFVAEQHRGRRARAARRAGRGRRGVGWMPSRRPGRSDRLLTGSMLESVSGSRASRST